MEDGGEMEGREGRRKKGRDFESGEKAIYRIIKGWKREEKEK